MSQTKFIFFDCMETIVDLYEFPLQSDYALWTFSNSGVEHYWNGFADFLEKYNTSRNEMRTGSISSKHTLKLSNQACKIQQAQLGSKAGMIGAAIYGNERLSLI